jgi:kynurenine formamidase
MKRVSIALAAILILCMASLGMAQEKWWPSRYGPDDELGACNELTPAKVLEAISLIKEGKIYDMGTEYKDGNPAFPPRFWKSLCLAHGEMKPLGKNKLTYLEEIFTGCPGAGSQLDGFAHINIGTKFYNGFDMKDVFSPVGVKKFGMEKVPPIVTRGVLIDMVAYRGRNLGPQEPITKEDLQGFLKKHNLEIRPGDAVFINTGWMRHFGVDNVKFISTEPGITIGAAKWLRDEKRVVGVGTDQWATEVFPNNDDPGLIFPVHQELLVKGGVHLLQNTVLDKLAEDKVYEFCYIFTHPKITGTTQGIGQPIAIK